MPPKGAGKAKAKAKHGPKAKAKVKAKAAAPKAKGKGKAKAKVAGVRHHQSDEKIEAPAGLGVSNPFMTRLQKGIASVYTENLEAMVAHAAEAWTQEQIRELELMTDQVLGQVKSFAARSEVIARIQGLEVPGTAENAEIWHAVKKDLVDKVNAVELERVDASSCLLLTFDGENYCAPVHASIVVNQAEWNTFKAALLAAPVEEVSYEKVGGNTSDVWMTSHEIVRVVVEISDPERVSGYLKAFPDGYSGSISLLGVLSELGNGDLG
eukprot:CAMPEP_0206587906 /NCGR_PEP_ID=MMETSP0325_2-20121206/37942_1 /ASSEMBLY_ACC=CAM_ASM_000347 /TAXON_ID=2866 /ORGANISM="Crypthecodinium cohnii, Strain Seligo" /LENGTH=266 /DNA_ID=CAMNT_0054096035 /DNA_START=60 /DNA_END=861 /DNA_ORIENTATION=-